MSARRPAAVGTTFRFALLLSLIVLAAVHWLRRLVRIGREDAVAHDAHCRTIVGADFGVDAPGVWDMYVRCMEGHPRLVEIQWAWTGVAMAGLLVVALIGYFGLPRWRCGRRGLVPLAVTDAAEPGTLEAELARLRDQAGLPARRVRFMLDPYSRGSGALVFGYLRRYVVCLHAGLVATRERDTAGFDAVIRHEFNHITNRDVDLTYSVIAVWRAFLVVVLAPALAFIVVPGLAGDGPKDVVGMAVLVTLVYLVRGDILRTREFHADVVPHDWGTGAGGRLSAAKPRWRIWRFSHIWRSHPSDEERRRAIEDRTLLYRAGPVPYFAGGTATALAAGFSAALPGFTLIAWILGTLLTLMAATLVWRSTVHVAGGSPVAQGWKDGIWLGAGLATGSLVALPGAEGAWPPHHPWVLVAPFAIGAVMCVWIRHVARAAGEPWRAAVFWTAQVAVVAAFGTLLAYFFQYGLAALGSGMPLAAFTEVAAGDAWATVPSWMTFWYPMTIFLETEPLAVVGAALLWVVPAAVCIRTARPRALWAAFGAGLGALPLAALAGLPAWQSAPPSAASAALTQQVHFALLTCAVIAPAVLVAVLFTLIDESAVHGLVAGGVALLSGVAATAGWLPVGAGLGVRTLTCGLFVLCAVVAITAGAVRARRDPVRRAELVTARSAFVLRVTVIAMVGVSGASGARAVRLPDAPIARPNSEVIRNRVEAWLAAGGLNAVRSLGDAARRMEEDVVAVTRLRKVPAKATAGEAAGVYEAFGVALGEVAGRCAELADLATRHERFIPPPDPAAETRWTELIRQSRVEGITCVRELDSGEATMPGLVRAARVPGPLTDRFMARIIAVTGSPISAVPDKPPTRRPQRPITAPADFMVTLCGRFTAAWNGWSDDRPMTPFLRSALRDLARPGSTLKKQATLLKKAIDTHAGVAAGGERGEVLDAVRTIVHLSQLALDGRCRDLTYR
ncbi:hypothetical protein DP939_31765 [Spongiactinospora rosea]|uniref:Peptidase M48 domain-containing protein n=1 Tax=Spongiactinospora rosea TaxID=2248750 RepID=A0A366LRN7_9ACTN|nr:M48 family metalloprotease [Spongiactinospora rosea]RBQ16193.1 hypothetical protein DP939_31765 [Spongiactinospora rosea]